MFALIFRPYQIERKKKETDAHHCILVLLCVCLEDSYLFSIYYFAWIKMALLSSKRILSPLLSFHQVYLIIYSTLISSGVMILTKSHSEAYFAYSCDLS